MNALLVWTAVGLMASCSAEGVVSPKYKLFEIRSGLVLKCEVGDGSTVEWFKDNVPVDKDETLKDRYKILEAETSIQIDRTVENDAGEYSCKSKGETVMTIMAAAKPTVRLPPNTSVVEGETLKLHCTVGGKPTPTVEWRIGNQTYNESSGRVKLIDDNGIKNAILTLSDITLDDRGSYYCQANLNIPNFPTNATEDSTFVRVKDSLAALWPFLGICAEVFVLCAIILIYEKRRNKPEMDESDTDQSPDQKHTPDHGKDRDIRHRK